MNAVKVLAVILISTFLLTGCGKTKAPAQSSPASKTTQGASTTSNQTSTSAQSTSNQSQSQTAATDSKSSPTSTPVSATTSTTVEPQALDPSQKYLLLQWVGKDADKLSPNDLKADGKPDGHFHLTAPFTQPAAVKSIWIRYSEFGRSYKWGWIYNQNLPLDGYRLAVFNAKGQQILPQGDNGYHVEGTTDFDLYISELNNEGGRDSITFQKNQTFDLEVDYVTQDNQEMQYLCSTVIN